MAVGLPSVVTDIPGNRQLIEPGAQGAVVPLGDSAALGKEIVTLLSDDLLRERMGQAARRLVVDNYATERVIDRYEALFAEVVR